MIKRKLEDKSSIIDHQGALSLCVRATLFNHHDERRERTSKAEDDRVLLDRLQMFLIPEYVILAPAFDNNTVPIAHRLGTQLESRSKLPKAVKKSTIGARVKKPQDDIHTQVSKVQRATFLSRNDYTVFEEMRELKNQIKKELFTGQLLSTLAGDKAMEQADDLDKLHEELMDDFDGFDECLDDADSDYDRWRDEDENEDYGGEQDSFNYGFGVDQNIDDSLIDDLYEEESKPKKRGMFN